MSVQPLIEMPASSCFAEVTLSIDRVVGRTSSPYSMQEQFFKWPGERWRMDLVMPPITNRDTANEWKAFGVKLQGMYGQFLFGDPSAKVPRGVATGSPKVDGANQIGNTLVTKGWTPNTTNILKAGDYIQLGSGVTSRMHMNVNPVDSDSSGNATLTLEPAVREAFADDSVIVVNNPVGLFRLSGNTFQWRVSPGPVYRISFSAEEVVT